MVMSFLHASQLQKVKFISLKCVTHFIGLKTPNTKQTDKRKTLLREYMMHGIWQLFLYAF